MVLLLSSVRSFVTNGGTTTRSSNNNCCAGKSTKSVADPKLAELNRFLRRHQFFIRSSFATFTTSKRRAFERDVYFFAKTLNLSEKVAKEEISKARKFCREDWSNSDDDSAWLDEIDDSLKISVSPGSRATSPTKICPTDAQPSLSQSLRTDREDQSGEKAQDFGESKLDPNLQSQLPGTQTSLIKKASKKRKLEQADEDDHEAKQTITKRDRTSHAKKARVQVSEAGDRDQVTTKTEASTSLVTKSSLTTKDEVPKSRRKQKRKKKGAEAQRAEELINQTDLEVSQGTEESPNNIHIAGQEEHFDIGLLRPKETVESGPENQIDEAAELCNDEEAVRSDREAQLNRTKESSTRKGILKLQQKRAKRAKRRAAQEIKVAKKQREAKPPEPQLSSDEKDSGNVDKLQAEQDYSLQDFHTPMIQAERDSSPRDFHSPMIQSVGQLLMRRCLKMTRFFTMSGNEEPILE